MDDQDKPIDDETLDETPDMSKEQITARFYFALTLSLCKEDLTKIQQIEEMPVYLILNTASHIKDRQIQEMNELKKLQNKKL